MNNIAHYFPSAGLTSRQQQTSDSQTAAYASQRSISTSESLETGLTIQTRDGDLITLNSSSYTDMDAYLYDSAGMVRTENGEVFMAESHREITLASGQSFSFSVEGNLSEEELADIDSLLKGLDKVISEMKSGDMEEALDEALHLGGFDTFASFAADISYERSYQMTSEFAAESSQALPVEAAGAEDNGQPLTFAPESGGAPPAIPDFGKLFDKLFENLEKRELQLFDKAAKPMARLLNHHLNGLENEDDTATSLSSTLKEAIDSIESRLNERFSRLLGEQFAAEQESDEDLE